MSQEYVAEPLPRARFPGAIWLAALLRPSLASFAALGQQAGAARQAQRWLFASGLIGALIQSLPPLEAQLARGGPLDMLLLALIPAAALIAAVCLSAFAWAAQRAARLLQGSGSYGQLAHVFAAFSAPLLILTSLLDLLPATRALVAVTYLYWLALYVLAVRAVCRLALRRAIAAVLATSVAFGLCWLAAAALVGYWGVLMP